MRASFRTAGLLVALACAVLPMAASPLAAQEDVCSFGEFCDLEPPVVTINPASMSTSDSLVAVTIWWEDSQGLSGGSKTITFNGQNAIGLFQHSGSGLFQSSTATLRLIPGSNSITAAVCDLGGNCDTDAATYVYTPPVAPPDTTPSDTTTPRYAVSLSPDGFTVEAVAGTRTTQGFVLRNEGNRTATYAIETPNCTVVSNCAATRSSVTLAPGGFTSVAVTHTVGAASTTGKVTLRARQTDPAVSPAPADTAWVTVQSKTAASAVPVGEPDTLGVIERDLCLTVAVAGGMYQCGDLVLAHGLPPTATLNKARAPVLVYNNEHAHPFPIVATRVALPATSTATQVRLSLRIAGRTTDAFSKTYPAWPAGQTRRIAGAFDALSTASYPTGVYDYTLAVDTLGASWGQVAPLTGRTGKLIIVNRSDSYFGPGWWLAGLEEIRHRPDGTKLWIGGDGSARLYRPAGANRWAATQVDRPDTLYYDGRPGEEYFRRLPGRAEVRFSAATGRHVYTRNRLGHRTTFGYDASGRLATITLPQGSGGGTPHRYTFAYTNGLLSQVTAPAADVARVLTFTRTGNELRIAGPDTTSVRYVTESGFAHRIFQRYDRMGRPVQYSYSTLTSKLWTVRQFGRGLVAVDTSDLVVAFSPAENFGVHSSTTSTQPYTLVNGPLPDTAGHLDYNYFWINRWGAPYRTTDAAEVSSGSWRSTYLFHDDERFPGLVTRVRYFTGREVTSSYDARGRVAATTDWSVPGYATTLYTWDDTWDAPTSITGPEGEVSVMAYDPQTGHRAWQQVGSDSTRRVYFTYHDTTHATAPGLVERVQSHAAMQRGDQPERLTYDARGNLRSVTSPLGVVTITEKDDVGRDVLVRSPIEPGGPEQTVQTWYDRMGRVSQSVSRGPAVPFTRTGRFAGMLVDDTATAQAVWVRNAYDRNGSPTSVSRWSEPDEAGVDTVTTWWAYDVFGRKVKESVRQDSVTIVSDSTVYSKAGLPVWTRTRRGHEIRMRYDVLGRLLERVVPAVAVPGEGYVPDSVMPSSSPYYRWNFPYLKADANGNLTVPNAGTTPAGLVIAADTARFTYDVFGMRTADNRDALIRREYYPSGQLKSETQRIRPYAGSDTTLHVYRLEYGYDRSGRRTWVALPPALSADAPLARRTYYEYDAQTGALALVRDSAGHVRHEFAYNSEGQLATFTQRYWGSLVTERTRYDADGRRRATERLRGPHVIHQDTFAYDARGKVRASWSMGDSTRHVYTGLGALAWSFTDRYAEEKDAEEWYVADALGNTSVTRRSTYSATDPTDLGQRDSTFYWYKQRTGRLDRIAGHLSSSRMAYDPAGNQVQTIGSSQIDYPGVYLQIRMAGTGDPIWENTGNLLDDTRSYFGADEKLRVIDRRACVFGWLQHEGSPDPYDCVAPYYASRAAFEEHRYDALGRRILTRTVQQWACANGCINGVTRTVWDGDQIVAEVRAPENARERDTGLASDLPLYDQAMYGRVLYVHGGGLDAPLALLRMDYDSIHREPQLIFPHTNALGSYDSGTFDESGASRGPCTRIFVGMATDREGYEEYDPNSGGTFQTDSADHCVNVSWPAQYLWRTHQTRQEKAPWAWNGSLIQNKRDASGQIYMRNRFYDPATGRFTQEDPIGIAGGLNVYGFAAGDPVNYSDPYGLSSCKRNGLFVIDLPECAARGLFRIMGAAGHAITMTEARYYVLHPLDMANAAVVVKETGVFVAEIEQSAEFGALEGVGNAVRHQYGQCAMTLMAGEEKAKTTGDLHEAERPAGEVDSKVDQENNTHGRALAKGADPAAGRGSSPANAAYRMRVCGDGVRENLRNGRYSFAPPNGGE